jgi:hypothetical protein
VAANRTADDIEHDIEEARASLALAVDQLAERASPKRIARQTRQSVVDRAQTPAGMAVLGGAAVVVALLVVRRVRRRSAG